MNSILIAIFIVVIVVLLIIFRKTVFVKKYGRYALIILPALVIILIRLISKPKKKEDQESKDNLSNYIAEVKDRLQEANMVTTIEITAAKEKNNQKLETLKETMAISNTKERRKRLAEMIG